MATASKKKRRAPKRTAPKRPFGGLVRGALHFAGVDQGIDFTGKGKVLALGRGVVTRVIPHGSGWPGEGALVAYRLTSGPRSGQTVYIAEDFRPAQGLHVGSVVKRGQILGTATGSGKAPGIEIGWANPSGSPVAPLNPNPHEPKPAGYDFYGFATGSTLGSFIPTAQAGVAGGPGPISLKDYIDKVLHAINAPITMTSELFLAAWTQKEGTKAQFNPLATTLKEPGSTNFNPTGVQNYPTPSVGEQATADTLLHGYPNIVQLLRHGVPTLDVAKPGVVSDLQLWGTGKRTGNAYAADVLGIYQKGTGQGAGNILGRPLTAAGDTAISAVTGWVGDLIRWIEGWAKRGLFVVGGFLLILLGIVIIGRQAATGTPKAVRA